jgi:hypothetical protein
MLVMMQHAFLQHLESSLAERIPRLPVELQGDWSEKTRRTYASETQLATGAGPYVDVVDRWWRGTLTCPDEISGIAFLLTEKRIDWAKAPTASSTLPVAASLHAYANHVREHATFTAQLGGAILLGVPVLVQNDFDAVCSIEPSTLTTGQIQILAQTNTAVFAVLLLPRMLLKFGRNRLWHLRQEFTTTLPPDICQFLTLQRAGWMNA